MNVRKYSFCMRVVDLGNSLPSSAVEAKTVESYVRRLDKLRREQPAYFNYLFLSLALIGPAVSEEIFDKCEQLLRRAPGHDYPISSPASLWLR